MNKIKKSAYHSRFAGGVCNTKTQKIGRIIERGNHDKLIAEKGKYYQLYTGAFELE